jgi:hypothetical protein
VKLIHLFDNTTLLEAKARIEHPEDLIFDNGLQGARRALQLLQATAAMPHSVTVKYDGSPALIAGWHEGNFVLTDKAGFSAKGYDGLTTSGDHIQQMIMNRKVKDTSDEAVKSRQRYAQTIADLYPLLKRVIPPTFQGFVQGDLMWTSTPPLRNGNYEFQPVKIKYAVPARSKLGQRIGASQVGMVFHSMYADRYDQEPSPIGDVTKLGFVDLPQLVILPHEIKFDSPLVLDSHSVELAQRLIQSKGEHIKEFFDPMMLTNNEIKAMPGLMKSFVAHQASQGVDDFSNAAQEFLDWLRSPASKATPKMINKVDGWISDHARGYAAVWQLVSLMVAIKMDLKAQIDGQVGGKIGASLRGQPGHEGFVSATDDGTVKLVNRAEFMKKQDLNESDVNKRVAWTFMRANPPTLGHQLVADQVAKQAGGDDYWIFLSQTQDSRRNPLDWSQKLMFAAEIMPKHQAHLVKDAAVKTPLQAANWLYEKGYRHLVMVVGSDRVASMRELLTGWNSAEVREKDRREQCQVEVVSAGERDPDAEGVSGISGTLARQAVQAGDFAKFESAVGIRGKLAKRMFDAVAQGMIKRKTVKEMWGLGKPDVSPDRTLPPASDDYGVLANWVKDVVAHEKSKGGDPVPLLSLSNPRGVWAPLIARLGGQRLHHIRNLLRQDPETAHMLDQAPFVDRSPINEADHSHGTILMMKLCDHSAQQLASWCEQNHIPVMDPSKLHLTVITSKQPMPALQQLDQTRIDCNGVPHKWVKLGDSALTIKLSCDDAVKLHQRLRSAGVTHTFDSFVPHVSVNYEWDDVKPLPTNMPQFDIKFDQLKASPIDPNWSSKS